MQIAPSHKHSIGIFEAQKINFAKHNEAHKNFSHAHKKTCRHKRRFPQTQKNRSSLGEIQLNLRNSTVVFILIEKHHRVNWGFPNWTFNFINSELFAFRWGTKFEYEDATLDSSFFNPIKSLERPKVHYLKKLPLKGQFHFDIQITRGRSLSVRNQKIFGIFCGFSLGVFGVSGVLGFFRIFSWFLEYFDSWGLLGFLSEILVSANLTFG